MARYAMAQGIAVPPKLIGGLASLRQRLSGVPPFAAKAPEPPAEAPLPAESRARRPASFAPAPIVEPADMGSIATELAHCHQQLARLVAPATPRTLLLLAEHGGKRNFLRMLGPVPLTRQMMFMALAFLSALIGLSTVEEVNPVLIAKGFFDNSGKAQLYCQSFLLCAAGLGACFSALFEVNRYVGRGVYDPKYDASYWSRLVLGLMAGVMLAELLGPQFVGDGITLGGGAGVSAPSDTLGQSATASGTEAFAKPTLAMLGGFSASLVHRILERLVQTVESLIAGSAQSAAKLREDAQRLQVASEAAEQRVRIAARLSSLHAHLAATPAARRELEGILGELLGATALSEYAPRATTPECGSAGAAADPAPPSSQVGGTVSRTFAVRGRESSAESR